MSAPAMLYVAAATCFTSLLTVELFDRRAARWQHRSRTVAHCFVPSTRLSGRQLTS